MYKPCSFGSNVPLLEPHIRPFKVESQCIGI